MEQAVITPKCQPFRLCYNTNNNKKGLVNEGFWFNRG